MTGPVEFAIDGKDETAWGIDAGPGLRNQPRKAVFNFDEARLVPGGTVLNIYLAQNHGGWQPRRQQNNNLGRVRLSVTSAPDAVGRSAAAERARRSSPSRAPSASPAAIRPCSATGAPPCRNGRTQTTPSRALARVSRRRPQLVLNERDRRPSRHAHAEARRFSASRQSRRARRAGVPQSAARRTLRQSADFRQMAGGPQFAHHARALSSIACGRRISASASWRPPRISARRATRLRIPELLDWLAVEFMDRGWGMKELQRLIVTSAAYRQSSVVTPELYAKDPYNRLIARGPRFRVDAEIVRDIALAASGLLNPQIGGPSVYPPAPGVPLRTARQLRAEDLERAEPARNAIAARSTRSASARCRIPCCRRSTRPTANRSCVRRARSNTPLQALTTLNEPLFVESAQALALRTLKDGGQTDQDALAYRLPPLRRAPADADRNPRAAGASRQENNRVSPKAGSTPKELRRRELRRPGATPLNWPHGPRCRACFSISTKPSPRNRSMNCNRQRSPAAGSSSNAALAWERMALADLLAEIGLRLATTPPIRWRPRAATCPRKRSTSFSSSWRARPATWSCSTTSRSSPNSTARCRRPNC